MPTVLHRQGCLADQARTGEVDVAHHTVDSPVGPLLLAATTVGLVRVAFAREDHDAALTDLAAAIGPRVAPDLGRLADTARQLDEYFAGRRRTFDLALDLRLVRGFRRAVLDQLQAIPYGTTATYRAVAARVDSPGAARAVGTACATNPLPVVVPCHRVVRGDGVIGNYLGGADTKRALLDLEAA